MMSRRKRERGAALLLVLWLLAMLTAIVATFALTARTEHLQSRHLHDATAARYAAEAGLEYAVVRMIDTDPLRRWQPDGRAYRFAFEPFEVEVRVVDESGKVDLNVADPDLLARLFMALDVEEPRARELAAAIVDWRDMDNLLMIGGAEDGEYAGAGLGHGAKDRPFDSVPELQQVLGMDHELFRRAEPYVTVFSGLARPDPAFAQAPVLTALGIHAADIERTLALRTGAADAVDARVGAQIPQGEPRVELGGATYSISSRAVRSNGTVAEIHATVRVGAGVFGRLYAPMQWRECEA